MEVNKSFNIPDGLKSSSFKLESKRSNAKKVMNDCKMALSINGLE